MKEYIGMFAWLPREIIHHIVSYLRPMEALRLRRVNKGLCDAVSMHQSYWYQQFCWYMIRQKKRPAMFKTGCARQHKTTVPRGLNCLSLRQEQKLIRRHNITLKALETLIATDATILADMECCNANHYIYVLPGSAAQIPLDSADYNPKDQLYIYRFLIHNYRQQRQRVMRHSSTEITKQLKTTRAELKKKRREIEQCRREVTRIKERDAALQSILRQLEMLEQNKVFYGRKSRQYQGVFSASSE